jgi:hypothetical protein
MKHTFNKMKIKKYYTDGTVPKYTMAKRKRTEGQTTIYIKLKIE